MENTEWHQVISLVCYWYSQYQSECSSSVSVLKNLITVPEGFCLQVTATCNWCSQYETESRSPPQGFLSSRSPISVPEAFCVQATAAETPHPAQEKKWFLFSNLLGVSLFLSLANYIIQALLFHNTLSKTRHPSNIRSNWAVNCQITSPTLAPQTGKVD